MTICLCTSENSFQVFTYLRSSGSMKEKTTKLNRRKNCKKNVIEFFFLYLQSFIGKTIISKLIRGSGEGQWRVV